MSCFWPPASSAEYLELVGLGYIDANMRVSGERQSKVNLQINYGQGTLTFYNDGSSGCLPGNWVAVWDTRGSYTLQLVDHIQPEDLAVFRFQVTPDGKGFIVYVEVGQNQYYLSRLDGGNVGFRSDASGELRIWAPSEPTEEQGYEFAKEPVYLCVFGDNGEGLGTRGDLDNRIVLGQYVDDDTNLVSFFGTGNVILAARKEGDGTYRLKARNLLLPGDVTQFELDHDKLQIPGEAAYVLVRQDGPDCQELLFTTDPGAAGFTEGLFTKYPPDKDGSGGLSGGEIAGIVIGIVVFLILVGGAIYVWKHKDQVQVSTWSFQDPAGVKSMDIQPF